MKRIALHLFLLIAATTLGLAIGYTIRHKTDAHPGVRGPAQALSPTVSKPGHRQPSRAEVNSGIAAGLERDLSTSSGVTRWLLWLEAIERAQPADFPGLARLAQGDPAALRFVAARWAEAYPRHLFDALVAALKNPGSLPVRELADVLFKEWPKQDPQAVIEALSGPENYGMRSSWRDQVAAGMVDLDPERGIRLFAQWHIDRFGPRMDAIAKWAANAPLHAAEFTLQNPAGYVSELTMETIASEWTKKDPAAALEFAVSHSGELALTLANAALKEWAVRNLNEAADWLAQADSSTRNRLAEAFVEPWAKQDAQSALSWSQENLSGSSLIAAVGAVLKGAAGADINAAATLVSSLAPSSARAEGAVAVAKKWFPQLSAGEAVKPEAQAWLSGLDPYSVKRVMDEVEWGWATSDPNSMAAFLASPHAAQVGDSAFEILARQLAAKDPVGTFDWANSLPGERAFTAGSEAYATWRTTQPEAATQWFNALPQNDPRRKPFFQSSIQTLAWSDPQAPEEFAAMSPADRAVARNVIEKMTLPDDRRASLVRALGSP